MKCPSCSQPIPDERVACPSCGTAVHDATAPTFMKPESRPPSRNRSDNGGERFSQNPTRAVSSFESIDDSRFVPGTIFAERYRIVGLLGRGGMGEVYRADDLKLGQPVALKFLPERLLNDGAALARFHREVRTARQISHRNVCRVYDIGEAGGHHFLSMEFIKGEELASLLKRIGRLPPDKAVEISRQLCAGLAAAHALGVLHRDLKPSNVMIDGEGNVRITDFGLAGLAEEFREDERHAGTPAYMAPEQLNGEPASVKSDIYSLGLVLYEIFTGRRAFEAASLAELINLRKGESTPTVPSSHVKEIDPVVERVILRCLEREPEKRPPAALAVAAALPGGDPLAAALAAGETPSPEMVAASLKEGALKPAVALLCLAGVLLALTGLVLSSSRLTIINNVPTEKSPEVLGERAHEIVSKLGYTDAPVDTDRGFTFDPSYYDYVQQQPTPPANSWDKIKTGQIVVLYFWYRQSPRYLDKLILEDEKVPEPALNVSGFTHLSMDTRGRLIEFYRVPQQIEAEGGAPSEPDWSALFAAAGIDPAGFQPSESQWVPPVAYDVRKAWEGKLPEHPEIPLRIEAAGFKNRPVYFQLVYPWTRPLRQEEYRYTGREWAAVIFLGLVLTSVLVGALLLARRNLRLGRGDRRGAFKLAFFVFLVALVSTFLAADHVPSAGKELGTLYEAVRYALFMSVGLWLIYIALEPYVRRSAPRLLISWSRLLAGEFRDPMIGRDVLVGGFLGLGHTVAIHLGYGLRARFVTGALPLASTNLDTLRGLRVMLMHLLGANVLTSIFAGLAYLFFLLLMYIIVRRQRLAALLMWLTILTIQMLFFAVSWHLIVANLIITTLLVFTTARFGLLAAITWQFFFAVTFTWPLTINFSSWYSTAATLGLAALVGLALYGFYTSLAGQPIFRDGILKE